MKTEKSLFYIDKIPPPILYNNDFPLPNWSYSPFINIQNELYRKISELTEIQRKISCQAERSHFVPSNSKPRYLNKKEAVRYVGKEKIFDILCQEYGLKPIRESHKSKIYCFKQLESICIQFERNIEK